MQRMTVETVIASRPKKMCGMNCPVTQVAPTRAGRLGEAPLAVKTNHPFGGTLTVRGRGPIALLRQGEFTMSEQAIEERRGWASDIMWVALYSILVLLAMLLWV